MKASQRSTAVMREIYARFWPAEAPHVVEAEILRHATQLDLLSARIPAGGCVLDLGGGWGAFAAGCTKLGYCATLIDDRRDPHFDAADDPRRGLPTAYGFTAVEADMLEEPWRFPQESLDAVTSFDSMEHWHHSPKTMFQSAVRSLRPGGWLIIGVPNAANLKKRIEAILGTTEWSALDVWYEAPRFRGHVREPTVRDLMDIAGRLGLESPRVLGFNWLGRCHESLTVARSTPWIDPLLRLRPGLCSDICLLARKPRP